MQHSMKVKHVRGYASPLYSLVGNCSIHFDFNYLVFNAMNQIE
jgi:hypothetical protein